MNAWFIRLVHLRGFNWLLPLFSGFLAAWLTSQLVHSNQIEERSEQLQTETERRAKTLMSFTMNGNLMGAIGLLGITDPDLKREARGEIKPDTTPRINSVMESTVRSFNAAGLFLADAEGNIGSSWYASGKAATGRSIKFRPYFRMAKSGQNNVYAAIGTGNHEPILYYAAPVFSGNLNQTEVVGALVARLGMQEIDTLLRDKADISLLLSPQDVVFAASKQEWIGKLIGAPSPERIRAIREVKQFGNMFDEKAPEALEMALDSQQIRLDGRLYALSRATVNWNDPTGEWSLIALEDLSRSIPVQPRLLAGALGGLIAGLLALLVIHLIHSREAQLQASQALAIHAEEQAAYAQRKAGITRAAIRLQSADSLEALCQCFLSEASHLLGAVQGVVYVSSDEPTRLTLAGCFACPQAAPMAIAFGEGILGQCALDRQSRILRDKEHAFLIRSGLGESHPAAVLIAPVLLQDKLLGITELALLNVPKNNDMALLEELASLLATSIEVGRFQPGQSPR